MRTIALTSAALLAAACGTSTSPELPDPLDDSFDPGTQPAAVQKVALTTFGGATACADLEKHLEDRAVLEMRLRVAQNKRYALEWFDWRQRNQSTWYGTGGGTGGGFAAGGGAGGGSGAVDSGSAAGPTDYTTTNTQVAGVDEADFMKNDGTRLFVLSGRKLFTASTWPAVNLARRGELAIEGHPISMFLEGDKLVVFSSGIDASFGYTNGTWVTHVDVSDLANPRVVARQRVPGTFSNARRIGSAMRLITSNGFPFLDSQSTWVDWNLQQRARSRQELVAMFNALAASNERDIRARKLAEWLPSPVLLAQSGAQTSRLQCEDIVSTNASSRLGLTNVVTLDLNDPARFSRQGLLAQVDEMYQSNDALYLSQRHWWWWLNTTNADHTYFYKFDITRPDRVSFVAAGRIDGTPVDQFSLDEHRGYFRVATTVNMRTEDGFFTTVNRVVVLGAQSGELQEVGRTEDLAPGERVMSARFMGDTGYVVTFRQTDPLYTVDLSDPAHPRKVGELKVPGFSTYIHPLDASHLLTIGTFVPDGTTDVREQHLQLAIFDVSDLAHPVQTHLQLVGRAWGWSDAQSDHKAFNYFPARRLLAIPFADWYLVDSSSWKYVSDLRVFEVDPMLGFTSKGSLDMADVLNRDSSCWANYGCWTWYWTPQIRRSVMADDFVYAVSSGGVRVANVNALDQPIATALFDPAP